MEQDAVCITKFVGWFKPMRSISNIGKCFSLVLPKMEKQSKLNTVNISNIHGLSLQNLPTLESTQQIREQMPGPDLLVFTLKFLALKKWFLHVSGFKKKFKNIFYHKCIMQLFSADAIVFSKKVKKKI